jgi:hypothetical protein
MQDEPMTAPARPKKKKISDWADLLALKIMADAHKCGFAAQRRHNLESYRQIVRRQPAWDRSCGLSGQVEGLAVITDIGMTRRNRLVDIPRNARHRGRQQ